MHKVIQKCSLGISTFVQFLVIYDWYLVWFMVFNATFNNTVYFSYIVAVWYLKYKRSYMVYFVLFSYILLPVFPEQSGKWLILHWRQCDIVEYYHFVTTNSILNKITIIFLIRKPVKTIQHSSDWHSLMKSHKRKWVGTSLWQQMQEYYHWSVQSGNPGKKNLELI